MVRFQTRSVLPDGMPRRVYRHFRSPRRFPRVRQNSDCLNAAVVHKPYGQSIGFSAMAESRSNKLDFVTDQEFDSLFPLDSLFKPPQDRPRISREAIHLGLGRTS